MFISQYDLKLADMMVYSADSPECECAVGYFLSGTTCEVCAIGTYKSSTGPLACTSCPYGQTTPTTGSTSSTQCSYCGQGYLFEPATNACAMCPEGTFNNHIGESQCFDCVSDGVPADANNNPLIPSSEFLIRCVCGCSTTLQAGAYFNSVNDYRTMTISSEAVQFNYDPSTGVFSRAMFEYSLDLYNVKMRSSSSSFLSAIRFRVPGPTITSEGNTQYTKILTWTQDVQSPFTNELDLPFFVVMAEDLEYTPPPPPTSTKRRILSTNVNCVYDFGHYPGHIRITRPWNIWVIVVVQIYGEHVYIKYQFEGEAAVVVSVPFTMTNTETTMTVGLGSLGVRANFEISHYFHDFFHSNSNAYNEMDFVTQCAESDHTRCFGLSQVPAGYQTTSSGANLEPCPVDHYNDGSLLKCAACPPGTVTDGVTGSTSSIACIVLGCAAGEYMNSGTCAACPADTYQDTALFSGSSCSPCPAGSSTMSVTGSTSRLACTCSAGYYGEAGGPCTECGADTYSDLAGQTSCTPCPTGSSTMTLTGSTSATACQCDAGYSGPDGGPCVICGADFYQDTVGSATCTECPSASTTNTLQGATSAGSCLCLPGYAGDLAVDSGCTACNSGFAKPELGPAVCYECAARDAHSTSVDLTASVACACVQGYAWNGTVCAACPQASYKDAVGNTSLSCALELAGLCCECDAHKTTATTASDAAGDCKCILGYEADTLTDECTACAKGSYKDGIGSGPCVACPAGATTLDITSTDPGECVSAPGYVLVYEARATVYCNEYIAFSTGFYGPTVWEASTQRSQYACFSADELTWGITRYTPNFYHHAVSHTHECSDQLRQFSRLSSQPSDWGNCADSHKCNYVVRFNDACKKNNNFAVGDYVYFPSDVGVFSPCPPDTYQPSDGGASCIACPTGAESPSASTAQADCVCNAGLGYVPSNPGSGLNYCVCAAGYYAVAGGACAPCPVGQFCPGSDTGYATTNGSGDTLDGAAQDCPANAHTQEAGADSSADCVCDAGYTEAAPGAARRLLAVTCIQCALNQYKPLPGNHLCYACPQHSGSAPASTSVLACECDAAYTGPDGGPCEACAVNTYKNVVGSAACEPCPANTTSPSGTEDSFDCVCTAGHSGVADGDFGPCSSCPPDTYKESVGAATCSPCHSDAASPAGSTNRTACLCNAGYTGPDGGACAACAPGTFKAAPGSAGCAPCHAASSSPAGSTMQFQLPPARACGDGACGCNATSTPRTGTCADVTGLAPGQLELEGFGQGVRVALPAARSLARIELKVVTGGLWRFMTGDVTCKEFTLSQSVVETVDVSDCLPTDDVRVQYIQPDTTLMVINHFVVYGAPPASCTCNAGYTAQSGACAACAANSYKDAQGDAACTACPAFAESPAAATAVAQCACPLGYTGDAHVGVDCSGCLANTYKNSTGAAACTDCPDHAAALALSDAADDCACNAGYTGSDGGPCTACVAGKYKGYQGSALCTVCPGDSSSPPASQDSFDCQCNWGYTGNDGETCSACPAGTYKGFQGSAACTACPGNSSSPAASQDSFDCLCNAGYTGTDGGACTACPADTYKTAAGAAACTPCSAHATAPAASVAATACECDPGYQGGHGTLCQQCPAGTYEDVVAHSCKLCPTHSFSPAGSAAATACTCNVGHTGPDGAPCEACAPNTYKNATGSAACTACTPFSTSAAGSVSADDCACDTDYVKIGDGSCGRDCVAGRQMSADRTTCVLCPNSYYKTEDGEHMCTRCPAHAMHGLTGQTSVDACYCEQGYLWDAATKTCEICPTGSFNNHANESQCFDCTQSAGVAQQEQKTFKLYVDGHPKPWMVDVEGDGVFEVGPTLYLERGGVYTFDQTHANNRYHQLGIRSGSAFGTLYTNGVVTTGWLGDMNPPRSDSKTVFTVPNDAPDVLWYVSLGSTSAAQNQLIISDPSPPELPASSNTLCPNLDKAPAGYQVTSSGANLEPCPVNHYNDGSLLQCKPCPSPSSFSSLGGLTSVAECVCQPGYERVGGVCTACGLGSYKTATGDGACTPCWAHATTLQTASTSPAHCKCVANYGTNKDCVLCEGHYGPQGDGATLVDPDMVWGCTNRCNCRNLATGISFDELIALNCPLCVPCGPNEFKNDVGGSGLLAWCLPCPNNSTLPIGLPHDPLSCRCDPGFTGDAGSGSGEWYEWHTQPLCTPCPIGSFKPAVGSAACNTCGDHTETSADSSTSADDCSCAPGFEDGATGGPDVGGSCVAECAAGSTGSRGACLACASGKFKAARGAADCSACPPPRSASRKGARSAAACACPKGKLGLDPALYHVVDGVGGLSTQDVESSPVVSSVPPSPAHRLRRLLMSNAADAVVEVYLGDARVFRCEARDCQRTRIIALHGSAQALRVDVLAGTPAFVLERHTRRVVTVTGAPAWLDQAELEQLALARPLRAGDYIFRTRTPLSTAHCQTCPRAFRCKDLAT